MLNNTCKTEVGLMPSKYMKLSYYVLFIYKLCLIVSENWPTRICLDCIRAVNVELNSQWYSTYFHAGMRMIDSLLLQIMIPLSSSRYLSFNLLLFLLRKIRKVVKILKKSWNLGWTNNLKRYQNERILPQVYFLPYLFFALQN